MKPRNQHVVPRWRPQLVPLPPRRERPGGGPGFVVMVVLGILLSIVLGAVIAECAAL